MGVLGLDVGAMGLKLVCLDDDGRLIVNEQQPHGVDNCPDHVVEGFAAMMLSTTAADLPLSLGACAVSGRIHADSNGIVSAPGLIDFEEIPLGEMLAQRLFLPIKVRTASAYALRGEREKGAGTGERDWLMFDLGP